MFQMNPPAYGHPDGGGGGGGEEERPPFVLIKPNAYFADRDNATTASCGMDGFQGKFKVTFCTAPPPLVSYICFHATDYKYYTDFAVEPHIIATETDGGLVLLRVVLGDHVAPMNFPHHGEYLVYDASVPSLEHLPCPTHVLFSDESVALVRKCTQGAGSHDYVLAAHSGFIGYGEPCQLYLYYSDTKKWETRRLVAKKPSSSSSSSDTAPAPAPYHSTCKTITIGGDRGIVAWVDLWHNIILCNVLARRPKLHYLELPAPMLLDGETLLGGDPSSIRDIAYLDGLFKFVEMQFHCQLRASRASSENYWEAKVWITKPGSSSAKHWIAKYEFKSSDVPKLPKLQVDPGRAQPTLSTLHTGLPKLSLQDDCIVYFLSKVYHCNNNHTAWVLAVNMKSKTVEQVIELNPKRTFGLASGYIATRISKYLKRYKAKPETTRDPDADADAGTSMVS